MKAYTEAEMIEANTNGYWQGFQQGRAKAVVDIRMLAKSATKTIERGDMVGSLRPDELLHRLADQMEQEIRDAERQKVAGDSIEHKPT